MSLDQALEKKVAELVDQRVSERLAQFRRELSATGSLPEVMTAQQVADALGCSRQHVNTLGRSGALRRKADGNRYLYLREWVLDFIRSDRSAPHMTSETRQHLAARS